MSAARRWPHHSSEGTQVHKQPLTVSGNARQIELYKRKQKIAVCPNHRERDRAGHRGSEGREGPGWRGQQIHLIQLGRRADKFAAGARSCRDELEDVSGRRKQYGVCLAGCAHTLPSCSIISPSFKCVSVPRPPTAEVPTLHPTPDKQTTQ